METNGAAVISYRGNSVENSHVAHVAVVDALASCFFAWGSRPDDNRALGGQTRAGLGCFKTGALERFDFDEADLALMSAPHSSEERHIERTRAMLSKAHAEEADLRCGGHAPLSKAV